MRYFLIFPNIVARWNGWRDRLVDRPNENSKPVSVENKYENADGQTVVTVVECASDFEARVCERANLIIHKLFEASNEKYTKLRAKYMNLKDKLTRAMEHRQQAKARYDTIHQEVAANPAHFRIPKWAYFLLVSILGLAEFTMNMQVFTVFGAPQYETLFMALILSFSFPVAGHYLGRILKERPITMPIIIIGTIFGIIAFWSIYYMSRLRSVFLTLTQEIGGPEMVHYAWMFFLFLNLLVMGVATFASYYSHEEDPTLERKRRALEKAARDYEKAVEEYDKIRDQLDQVKGEYDAVEHEYRREAEAVANRGQELIRIYRVVNLRRKNPPNLQSAPDITVPAFQVKPLE